MPEKIETREYYYPRLRCTYKTSMYMPEKIETRGRKKMNPDGTKRIGRYVKCSHCAKDFFYDYRDPKCKPTHPSKKTVSVEEEEQAKIDQLLSSVSLS